MREALMSILALFLLMPQAASMQTSSAPRERNAIFVDEGVQDSLETACEPEIEDAELFLALLNAFEPHAADWGLVPLIGTCDACARRIDARGCRPPPVLS